MFYHIPPLPQVSVPPEDLDNLYPRVDIKRLR